MLALGLALIVAIWEYHTSRDFIQSINLLPGQFFVITEVEG